jgi:nucleoside-diphosphate-sugar epimerase
MARILIVGGGCRGRRLARRLVEEGRHAVRITTRTESGRAAIEATGAECLIGTPDRLASMRGALEGVTIACWLLATARGDRERVQALHGSRVESFLSQAIDTTMRGFVYETGSVTVGDQARAEGERIVRGVAERNAIPAAILTAGVESSARWQAAAWEAVDGLLGGRVGHGDTLSWD